MRRGTPSRSGEPREVRRGDVALAVLAVAACFALGACSSGRSSSAPDDDAASASPVDGASSLGDGTASSGDVVSVQPPGDDADTPTGVDGGPGGPWIAFVSTRTGHSGIFLVHPDGTGLVPLVTDAAENISPSWSPDGARIAFVSTRGRDAGGYGLFVVEVATTEVTPVETGLAGAVSPAWSPDGALLAFGGPDGLYTVPVLGATASPLTTGNIRDNSPAWAPDGTLVYFASDRGDGGTFDVWSVAPDGGDLRRVTTGTNILGGPAVSPDGGALALAQATSSSTQVIFFDLATSASSVFSAMGDSEPAFSPSGASLAVTTVRYTGSPEVAVLGIPGAVNPFLLTPDAGGLNSQAAYQPGY